MSENITIFSFFVANSHNYYTVKKAVQIIETAENDNVREVPEYQYIRDFLVESMVKEIKFKDEELTRIEVEIKLIVDKMGYKLHTMTGIDLVTAAKLIGEIGDIERFPTPAKLAKYAGVAPITYSSGQKDKQLKATYKTAKPVYSLVSSLLTNFQKALHL
ncbi:MAG: IS110 family transposase [Ignavibacteriales bacterium]|nr:IS110 family transposase [Ignavibacteriales bacterium]